MFVFWVLVMIHLLQDDGALYIRKSGCFIDSLNNNTHVQFSYKDDLLRLMLLHSLEELKNRLATSNHLRLGL